MNYDVIVVASGKGTRANLGYNKAFYRMKDGNSVLEHSLSLFLEDQDCKNIIVVTSEEYMDEVPTHDKLIKVIGGKERKDSVANGLRFVNNDYVLIHDAVRPFLSKKALDSVKDKLSVCDAVCLGHMSTDTVKLIEDGKIVKTIERSNVFMAETPQGFRSSLIKECYEKCEDINFTDDSSLVESLGYTVEVVINDSDNHKLTMHEDFKDL